MGKGQTYRHSTARTATIPIQLQHKEISEQLGVSVPTVNTYIRRIYEKLQVRSRSEAIARYFNKPS